MYYGGYLRYPATTATPLMCALKRTSFCNVKKKKIPNHVQRATTRNVHQMLLLHANHIQNKHAKLPPDANWLKPLKCTIDTQGEILISSTNIEKLSTTRINTTDIPTDPFVLCQRTIAIQPAEPVTSANALLPLATRLNKANAKEKKEKKKRRSSVAISTKKHVGIILGFMN